MPRFNNTAGLTEFREKLKKSEKSRKAIQPVITIGMGTCGIAAGAGEILQTMEQELEKRGVKATIRSVGCIGMCAYEPLIDIQIAGQPRVTYINMRSKHVPQLVEEHILEGRIIHDWAIGYIPLEW